MFPIVESEHSCYSEELVEYVEIKLMLEIRLSGYNPENNKSWDEIRKDQ